MNLFICIQMSPLYNVSINQVKKKFSFRNGFLLKRFFIREIAFNIQQYENSDFLTPIKSNKRNG